MVSLFSEVFGVVFPFTAKHALGEIKKSDQILVLTSLIILC